MEFQLAEEKYEISDNFEGYDGWVGISHGDIYLEGKAFGYYVGVWYPNIKKELSLIVSVVDKNLECKITIGIVCPVGEPDAIKAVNPHELPWEEDGVIHCGFIEPKEIEKYTKAKEAFEAAKFIINNDNAIFKYISAKALNK